MNTDLERLRQDHRPVFLSWLTRRDETGLRQAYELGRKALECSIGLLDLVRIHNEAYLDIMRSSRTVEDASAVAAGAAEFLIELVAPFEMARRGFLDLASSAAPSSHPTETRQR